MTTQEAAGGQLLQRQSRRRDLLTSGRIFRGRGKLASNLLGSKDRERICMFAQVALNRLLIPRDQIMRTRHTRGGHNHHRARGKLQDAMRDAAGKKASQLLAGRFAPAPNYDEAYIQLARYLHNFIGWRSHSHNAVRGNTCPIYIPGWAVIT